MFYSFLAEGGFAWSEIRQAFNQRLIAPAITRSDQRPISFDIRNNMAKILALPFRDSVEQLMNRK